MTLSTQVILVYNPQIATHDTEVGLWYDQFVKNAGISGEEDENKI